MRKSVPMESPLPASSVPSPTQRSSSCLDSFRALYEQDPRRTLFTFVDDSGRNADSMTVAQLRRAGEGVAENLAAWGLSAGDRVLLVYPPSLEFVQALLGCLMAGVIAAPAYPPDPLRPGTGVTRLGGIIDATGAKAVLTGKSYNRIRRIGSMARRWKPAEHVPWYVTDESASSSPVTWHEPASADEVALLQYTSGSTSSPRGVMITHGNLTAEIGHNRRDLGLNQDTVTVSWVPQYHDMGLISVILSTLAGHGHTYLLSPLTFLGAPELWGTVMSRVRATHTCAPNFAYELLVRRTTPEMRRKWDLSSLKVALWSAEPVRPASVDRFLAAFRDSGFPPEAIYGAFGLAENTVTVTMGGRDRLAVDRYSLAENRAIPVDPDIGRPVTTYFSSGRVTKPGSSVRIVDPETRLPCSAETIGEIWVDSDTKAAGYYGLPEESEHYFHARIDGEDREYLRTGDTGFFHSDNLYVTGRLKDLIIINGRNVHPADLEDSVRTAHPLIRPGGIAAFGVPADELDVVAGEKVVLFVEIRGKKLVVDQATELARVVRRRLFEDHQIPCSTVVIGHQGLVRKTTSGKIRRNACREDFLAGPVKNAHVV
ncbi:fatty acyl-AMP ligase [Amycolatopsis sp. EV170708-02-1]|uniref:fatty acyl-AMP ligase n=1 Tax=Amycolatopsis sp. EV170708-02-1 TaxID=2919322 RepID=UPI001F0B7757|nr:fatty acyl-AMP ligase [Amycolatopsis sp. EV170708-02-1]UMP06721.1 fatty acyl-AMP ligase [Amycolatopsis sp. EV170708-02-1]